MGPRLPQMGIAGFSIIGRDRESNSALLLLLVLSELEFFMCLVGDLTFTGQETAWYGTRVASLPITV